MFILCVNLKSETLTSNGLQPVRQAATTNRASTDTVCGGRQKWRPRLLCSPRVKEIALIMQKVDGLASLFHLARALFIIVANVGQPAARAH